MFKKIRDKINSSNFFTVRFLVVLLAFISFSFYSIGYAYFSTRLNFSGDIGIAAASDEVVVSNIGSAVISNNGVEVSSPTYSGTTANFSVQLIKNNSTLTYSVTVRNDSSGNIKYDSVNIENSNSGMTYSIDGMDTSTIIASGEEFTFDVIIHYTDDYLYDYPSSKQVTMSLEFVFYPITRDKFISLSGYITEDSGNVTDSSYGASATITIQNDNAFPVTCSLYGANNFVVYNSEGVEGSYSIGSNSSATFSIYINDSDTSVAIGTSAIVSVMASALDYGVEKNSLIDTITLTLESKGKYEVLSDGYAETPNDVDYSSNSASGGIYSESGIGGKKVFYYRGNVSDNYFSFAGLTWRILRIDENSNMRLILNSLITSSGSVVTKQFKTTNTASSLDDAKTLLKLVVDANTSGANSPVYGYIDDTSSDTLRGWYNNTIVNGGYESYVVDSLFCMDTEGGNATSSGTQTSVFYFAPYQRVGVDTALYDPDFNCPANDQLIEKVGLLTADEYIFAGGAFRVSNTSFFLNDGGISNSWWTMSPAYYDSGLSTVGLFMVYSNGSITDWPDGNTIKNSYGIRPVITVNGNYTITGDGTSSNPYKFS